MLFTTHAVTGAAIGTVTGNPAFAFALAWISHHVLDIIPHNDPGSWFVGKDKPENLTREQFMMATVDCLLGFTLVAGIIWYTKGSLVNAVIAGAIGGTAPDLLDNLPHVQKVFRKSHLGKKYHVFHEQYHRTLPWSGRLCVFGLGFQVLLIGGSMLLLLEKIV